MVSLFLCKAELRPVRIDRMLLHAVLLLVFFAPQTRAGSRQQGLADSRLHPFRDGARIVWLGDSITHFCLYTRYLEDYARSRYPKRNLTFVNCGVSADTSKDVLNRFDMDVAPWRGNQYFVCLGMNDGGFKAFDEQRYIAFKEHMSILLDRILSKDARVILITPTPIETNSIIRASMKTPQIPESYNLVLSRYSEWLEDEATRRNLPFVNLIKIFTELQERIKLENPAASIVPDGIHPSAAGSCIMSLSILASIGENKKRLSIVIGADNKTVVKGGKLRELIRDKDGLAFRFTAKSLPWVLPLEARAALVIDKSYAHLNSSILSVKGLQSGYHSLYVDGRKLVTKTKRQWEVGVDFGLFTKHPDWLQSLALTNRNGTRNARIRRGIRELWFSRKLREKLNTAGKSKEELYLANLVRIEKLETGLAELGEKVREADEFLERTAPPKEQLYVLQRER